MGNRQAVPYASDLKAQIVPAHAITPVPVAGVAYASAELAAGIPGWQATATGSVTAIFDIDLPLLVSLSSGLGPKVSDIVVAYNVGVHDCASAPTFVLDGVTFGAVGATEATPGVVNTAGGTLTTSPGTLPVVANASGKAYNVKAILGTQLQPNTDLVKHTLRLSAPLADAGTFMILGAIVHFESFLAAVR